MKLNNVHHIAINTNDIDESIAFYRDILGFQEVHTADMGSCILTYMKVSEDAYIELFDIGGNTDRNPVPENHEGIIHIAFDVDGLLDWESLLKKRRVNFVMEVTEMPQIQKRALLIKDPNGVVIELCESM